MIKGHIRGSPSRSLPLRRDLRETSGQAAFLRVSQPDPDNSLPLSAGIRGNPNALGDLVVRERGDAHTLSLRAELPAVVAALHNTVFKGSNG